MSEPITIVFLTYERTEYALRTIDAAIKHLKYPDLAWFIADDGSSESHVSMIYDKLVKSGQTVSGVWSKRDSYGKSANQGIFAAHKRGRLMFFLEDDWELTQDLDLWQYADLLMQDESIGMVRLGYLNTPIKGETFGYNGHIYWLLDDDSPYIFAGHPSLRHERFHDHAGLYTEGVQPGETELAMAWSYKQSGYPKPGIVWPCELGQHGIFAHIGAQQSYIWNGGERLY